MKKGFGYIEVLICIAIISLLSLYTMKLGKNTYDKAIEVFEYTNNMEESFNDDYILSLFSGE